jgi:hypothetical protein
MTTTYLKVSSLANPNTGEDASISIYSGVAPYIYSVPMEFVNGSNTTTNSITVNFMRLGNMVSIWADTYIYWSSAVAATIESTEPILPEFIPKVTQILPAAIANNSLNQIGSLAIDTSGYITVGATLSLPPLQAFTASHPCAFVLSNVYQLY